MWIGDEEGFPALSCVLIPSHQPPLFITVVCGLPLDHKNIFFIDDNFCFKKRRTKEVCTAIEASQLGKKCNFSLQTRADNFYPEVVPMLKAAGFGSVGFGMEAGTDDLLKLIGKNETVKQSTENPSKSYKFPNVY